MANRKEKIAKFKQTFKELIQELKTASFTVWAVLYLLLMGAVHTIIYLVKFFIWLF